MLTDHRARRENRGTNGTVTLRRSSTTPHGSSLSQSSQEIAPLPTIDDQMPLNSGQAQDVDGGRRYTREALLEIYRNTQSSDFDVSRLLDTSWDPESASANGGRGWGKTGENRDNNYGPDVCWDQPGNLEPIGLDDMSALEKSVGSYIDMIRPALELTSRVDFLW